MAQSTASVPHHSVGVTGRPSLPCDSKTNAVAHDILQRERITKEERHFKPHIHFCINPLRPGHVVTGKLNSWAEAEMLEEREDPYLRRQMEIHHLPPTAKYECPQTTNQEYGWVSHPLLEYDRTDDRFYNPHSTTDATRYKALEWSLKPTPPYSEGGQRPTASSFAKPPSP